MMTTQITTALITGASSGIGAVYADRLARALTWSGRPPRGSSENPRRRPARARRGRRYTGGRSQR